LLLTQYAKRDDVVVLALPRGGVPVAFEVIRALEAPLDVFLVRKLGAPGHPEFAIGAIASGGVQVLNQDAIADLRIPSELIEQVAERERGELERRDKAYHVDRPLVPLQGKTIIVVDDGLATGSTMEAAVLALSPIALLLLVGAASPGYLDAYRTTGGTVVAAIGALLIFGCYLLMRRLGRVPEPRRTGVRR